MRRDSSEVSQRRPSFWELAIQATTNTRQGYNLLAPRFETTDYATPTWLIEACQRRAESLYGPLERETARAADLACGTGRGAAVLAQSCAQVDGFDFSPLMLAEARRMNPDRETTAFSFKEADLSQFVLPQERYDRIVTFGAWGHILPEWRQAFLESAVAGLKPGGVFYTVTADAAPLVSRRWWMAAAFDLSLKLRNRLLGEPFHMYYLLNRTLEVAQLLRAIPEVEVRLEPVPGSPHPDLTLLMARRSPADKKPEVPKTDRRSKPETPER